MTQKSIEQLYSKAYKDLLAVNRKSSLLNLTRTLLYVALFTASLLLLYVLMDLAFSISVPVRISFWVILFGALAMVVIRYVIPELRRAYAPVDSELFDLARQIGKQDDEVQDAIINFLQIYDTRKPDGGNAFRSLSLKQLYQTFRETDFFSIISPAILKRPAVRLLGLAGVFLLLMGIAPANVSESLLKVLQPTKSFEKPLPISLENTSGSMSVLKNESVTLAGTYDGVAPHRLWLVLETALLDSDSNSTDRIALPVTAGKRFNYELNHVKNSFRYWFEAELNLADFHDRPANSTVGEVAVKDRPFVRHLQVKVTPPAYTRLPARLLPPNDGEVSALKGTRITVDIEANKKLAEAMLLFDDDASLAMDVVENRGKGSFLVKEDGTYRVHIADQDSISNYKPVQYSVFALQDEMPFVEITEPGQDLELGNELAIPLLISLRDDYGFRQLKLAGHHIHAGGDGDTTAFSIPLTYQLIDPQRAVSEHAWDLTPFYLIPDDYIEYYAEVIDNDRVTGPKVARSKTFVVRLPSIIEILERSDQEISESLEETDDLRKETEKLREKLEEINREMLREKELTWERQQEIQAQMEKQKQAVEKLDEIRENIEQLTSNLQKQDMLSEETLEKFMELQKMYEELATPQMLEAMEKMQKALEESDMKQLKSAMEQMQMSVEEFEKRIERTHELFKQVEMEQQMDELVNMAEKLAEEQQSVNEELQKEDLSDAQKEQLANKEEALEKNADYFEEKLDQSSKEFEEMMAKTAEELEKAREFMEQQEVPEQMQQMSQQMQQNEMQEAQQSGENLQQQLNMMQSMMQQAQQNMNQAQKEQLMMAMQKVQQDMLRSSFEQEKILERSRQSDMASSQLNDLARSQAQMRENTTNMMSQLMDISKQTFFISPQMSQIMTSLMENMESSLENLANRNPRGASQFQSRAMSDFNRAIMSMQSSMSQMQQAGSASGFQEMMQQLQQMAGQQGQLNQETMGMMPQLGQNGKPTPEQLGRLAAQQQMIQEAMEKMNQEMGNRGDVLGRLGEIGDEMEKVVDDLRQQRLDPKVVQRQQQILSRLLDAQKSVREKEHSRKRQSEREAPSLAKSPPQLKKELVERENELRKELLNALKEGYSSEYKEYIKTYYDILSRQSQSSK